MKRKPPLAHKNCGDCMRVASPPLQLRRLLLSALAYPILGHEAPNDLVSSLSPPWVSAPPSHMPGCAMLNPDLQYN